MLKKSQKKIRPISPVVLPWGNPMGFPWGESQLLTGEFLNHQFLRQNFEAPNNLRMQKPPGGDSNWPEPVIVEDVDS